MNNSFTVSPELFRKIATVRPLPDGSTPISAFPPDQVLAIGTNDALKRQTLKTIAGALAVSALAGGGLRALIGHRYLFGRPGPETVYKRPRNVIGVPVPGKEEEDEKPIAKMGSLWNILDRIQRDETGRAVSVRPPGWNDDARSMSKMPLFWAGMTAAGLGGLYGGYKLTDMWLDSKRKADLEQEIEDAKKDYRNVLLSQYNPGVKTAGVDQATKTADAIDSLFDKIAFFRKQADGGFLSYVNPLNWLGVSDENQIGLLSYPLALMAALGMYSGWSSYQNTRARSTSKLLEDVFKKREQKRWSAKPTDFVAVPMRMPVKKKKDDSEDESPIASEKPRISNSAPTSDKKTDWEA